jgi:hypothetical protein
MWRPLLGGVAGLLAGAGLTALILRLTWSIVARIKEPVVFEIEPTVIYQSVVLGAGFGAVCGTLCGMTAAMLREWRRGRTG